MLEALRRYHLASDFRSVVCGIANGAHVVRAYADDAPKTITSLSLRSLAKTVLGDTNPETNSATDRSRVLSRCVFCA